MSMRRTLFTEAHGDFRDAFRSFLLKHAVPHTQRWEDQGFVDRPFWTEAGAAGFLSFEAPEEYGGLGVDDFRYNVVIAEELVANEVAGDGFALHNDIVTPYLLHQCSPQQQRRWLPGCVAGDTVTAIAMTEPGAGSDLAGIRTTARFEGDEVVLDGAKTFITNGTTADLVFVLARTGETSGRGMTLVAVEVGTPGFEEGRPLHKIGRRAQDTGEMSFTGCRVPAANIVGEPGRALELVKRNLPRERLSIAVTAVAGARHAFGLALDYCKERQTFGQILGRHQTVLHRLAEMHTAIEVTASHVDRCVEALNAGELTAEEAAAAKLWATETQWSVTDQALQLFGGYGYMEEYPIARIWRDARVQRIYGGTSEIMTEIVGRGLLR